MPGTLLEFTGRERELEVLTPKLSETLQSNGGLLLLSGEAGIGKSRLAEDVARRGREMGMDTFWGRAWETGGAPPFSPWIQVLKGLRRTPKASKSFEQYGSRLSLLLGETGVKHYRDAEDPERSRFQLFEAVTELLCGMAEQQPLLLVLEDLHVADRSTLELLDFMALHLRSAAVLVLGTFRQVEAQAGDQADLLRRLAQDAQTLPLGRLSPQSVERILVSAIGSARASTLSNAVYKTTEGHPLYVIELCRLLVTQGRLDDADPQRILAASSSLARALDARLAGLSEDLIETLERASVAGRELNLPTFAGFCQRPVDEVRALVDELVTRAFLLRSSEHDYAFSHVLIREGLYRRLSPERRTRWHLALADCMRERGDTTPWSLVAHHLLAAGEPGVEAGIEALLIASREARDRLAYVEAIALLERGLSVIGDCAPEQRFELLLALGELTLLSGDLSAGQRICIEAAAIARQLSPEYLARAALVFGELLVFAHVDLELISLLEEALERMPQTASPIRARLTARLAAARQPAEDPQQPIELAKEAVAMARTTGDRDALLFCLGAAGSTMMDFGDAATRLTYDQEYTAMAESSDDAAGAFRGYVRLIIDSAALADMAAADGHLRKAERLDDRLEHHPQYRSRLAAARAMWAMWRGELATAEKAIDLARSLGSEAGDPNAQATYVLQRAKLLRLAGRSDELLAHVPAIASIFPPSSHCDSTAATFAAAYRVAAGQRDAAQRYLARPQMAATALRYGDRTILEALAELAVAASDRDLATRLLEVFASFGDQMITGGVMGYTIDGPVAHSVARCARLVGDLDLSTTSFEQALDLARRTSGLAALAYILNDFALALLDRRQASDIERAHGALAEAEQLAEALGLTGLLEDIRSTRKEIGQQLGPPAKLDAPGLGDGPEFAMVPEGDYWTIRHQGREFRLRNTKGMPMLARLVAEPGRDFHVLDLAGGGKVSEVKDLGDSGEVLDDTARAQYKARLEQLQAELEQAQAWNDAGRVERIQGELHFLAQQLSSALGLGGRVRRSGAAAERARVNVQRRIRDSIKRIAKQDAALGKHLDKSVRTGVFCCYHN